MPRTHTTDDGATLRFTATAVEWDDAGPGADTHTRYERERDGDGGGARARRGCCTGTPRTASGSSSATPACWSTRSSALDGSAAAAGRHVFTFVVSRDPAFDRTASVRDRLPPAGRALAAGMLGLDEAIYGERPKVEIVAEADADGLDLGDVDLDLEDPSESRMTIEPETPT